MKILSSQKEIGNYEKNIGILFLKSLRKNKDKPFFYFYNKNLGWKFKTFEELFKDTQRLIYFFKEEGFLFSAKRALTFSENSYNMLIWELALLFSGIASVSIWNEEKAENISEILEISNASFGFVSSAEKEKNIKKISKIPLIGSDLIEKIKKMKVKDNFVLELINKIEPEMEAFIQFTSGSTGKMKGVILTHKNITSQQKSFSLIWKIPSSSIFLSYLPWHHSYGGLFERFIAINYGIKWYVDTEIGKNIDKLFFHWENVKPTHFFSVPKVYVEILKKIKEDKKLKNIFFHKNLKILFTAGAPLPSICSKYFEKNGVVVMEGWGLTETSPTVTLTSPYGGRVHSYVGFPIPGCEIKVDKEGEIYVKGPNVMKGYLQKEKIEQPFEDGWFKTGDIGKITKKGLKLICRKDGIFKLSNGRKVASFPIEEKINFISKDIKNVIVFGQGMEKASALVFTDPSCNIEKLKLEILKKENIWKPKNLPFYALIIIPKVLSIEKGELTATQKIIRNKILENYKRYINMLFRPSIYSKLKKNILLF